MSDEPYSVDPWMAPAVRELERLIGELAAESWPPSPWTRYKFEIVLIAAEQEKFEEAYDGVLWSRDRFNRFQATAALKPVPSSEPSLADYQARVDAVRIAASTALARLEAEASPPATLDI